MKKLSVSYFILSFWGVIYAFIECKIIDAIFNNVKTIFEGTKTIYSVCAIILVGMIWYGIGNLIKKRFKGCSGKSWIIPSIISIVANIVLLNVVNKYNTVIVIVASLNAVLGNYLMWNLFDTEMPENFSSSSSKSVDATTYNFGAGMSRTRMGDTTIDTYQVGDNLTVHEVKDKNGNRKTVKHWKY